MEEPDPNGIAKQKKEERRKDSHLKKKKCPLTGYFSSLTAHCIDSKLEDGEK